MFILKVLGGASLEGPEGPLTGRVAQKRRLAVLALLALSRRPGVARDKLAGMVWPESDSDRARHLLSDSIYVVNRALGGEVVVAVADEVRLQPARLSCDARMFEDAIEHGALDEAARLFAGPFLDGFFLEGCEEFERWAATERDRLHAAYTTGLERLATDRDARGDRRGSLDTWRTLAADDPLNSRLACRLSDALRDDGDVAGAIQTLHQHQAALAEELGIGPPVEVSTRQRRLLTPSPVPLAPSVHAAVGPVPADSSLAGPVGPSFAAAVPDGETAASPVSPTPMSEPLSVPAARSAPNRRSLAVAVGAALALVAALATTYARWPTKPVAATAIRAVAVLPFTDLSPGRDQEYVGMGWPRN